MHAFSTITQCVSTYLISTPANLHLELMQLGDYSVSASAARYLLGRLHLR